MVLQCPDVKLYFEYAKTESPLEILLQATSGELRASLWAVKEYPAARMSG